VDTCETEDVVEVVVFEGLFVTEAELVVVILLPPPPPPPPPVTELLVVDLVTVELGPSESPPAVVDTEDEGVGVEEGGVRVFDDVSGDEEGILTLSLGVAVVPVGVVRVDGGISDDEERGKGVVVLVVVMGIGVSEVGGACVVVTIGWLLSCAGGAVEDDICEDGGRPLQKVKNCSNLGSR
jgi:hypothetical protein